ncbi:MAG: histidinol-phosphate transaminase [Negativicutes bacterium]|nr:histidinol-phosphate transaminase [Negativicutes bacterium]
MNKECKVEPRDVLAHLHVMKLQLPDKTIDEIRAILGVAAVTKLSFNESPYGPSPRALAAMRAAAAKAHLYHDPESKALRQELAGRFGVQPEQIVVGNGGDDIITLLTQSLLSRGDEAVIPLPTFGQYAAAVTLTGARPVRLPVRQDMAIDLAAMTGAITAATKMIFLCNPNNPTGLMLDPAELRRFLAAVPPHIVVVLDEAYAEFVTDPGYLSGVGLLPEFPNLFTVRTFSKIYGLAGLRLGYGIAHERLTGFFNKARNPFNVNVIAQETGLAALRDTEFIRRVATLNAAERDRLTGALTALGYHVYPSQANFLFVDLRQNCAGIFEGLARKGIIIRPGTTWNMPNHVRISLGNKRQNLQLLAAWREIC